MTAREEHSLQQLATLIAEEVGRQIHDAGLPFSLGTSIARQVRASGVGASASEASPFGLLVLLSFDAAGGAPIEAAAPAAAAMQFLIAAGDVLDDIQDGDPVLSLDDPSPGSQAELLASLMALSHGAIASVRSPSIATSAVVDAIAKLVRLEMAALAGQNADVNTRAASDVSVAAAAQIISAKSGSLGRVSAEVGAALATTDTELIARLGDFGQELAIVNQIVNDVRGVWPGAEANTDLQNARPTLPIALGMQTPSAGDLLAAMRDAGKDPAKDALGRKLLADSGALHKAWAVAGMHHARARACVAAVLARNPQSRLHDLLTN